MKRIYRRTKKTTPSIKRASRDYFIRKRKKIKKIVFWFLFVLIIAGLFYFLFYGEFFKIKEITITRQENVYHEISNEELKNIVSRLLDQSRFLIFSQDNIFFFSKKLAEKELRKWLGIDYLKIKKGIDRKIEIEIKDKLPAIVFQFQEQFYYLDNNGKIDKEVSAEKIDKSLPLVFFTASQPQPEEEIVEDLEKDVEAETKEGGEVESEETKDVENEKGEEEIKIEEPVTLDFLLSKLTAEKINFVLQLFHELPARISDLEVVSFEFLNPQSSDVKVHTSKGYAILFDQTVEIERQLNNLVLVLDQKLKDQTVEYIDVRYKERVYYK